MKMFSAFLILSGITILIQGIFTAFFFVLARHFHQMQKYAWIPVAFLGALCALMLFFSNLLLKKK
jgi:hypothetical protein